MLARGSGNLYSPLNADPIGKANLGLYDILAQAAVSFPYPSTPDENSVYDALSTAICGAGCNVRNQYANTNIDVNNLLNTLSNIGTYKATCRNTGNTSAACNVWNQLYAELNSLSPIRGLEQNLTNFWTASGTNSILSLLSTAAAVKASIPDRFRSGAEFV